MESCRPCEVIREPRRKPWLAGWSELRQPERLPPTFARALLTAADGSGQADLALEISSSLTEGDTDNADLRRSHAERLLAGGQTAAAVDEARLAFGLDPDSQEARRLLARALQAAERPADALTVLGAEAGADSKTMAAAAAYALEAGQADRALAWSLRLLDQEPRFGRGRRRFTPAPWRWAERRPTPCANWRP